MKNKGINGDYSCGNCGWTGWVDDCEWDENIKSFCCPECGQDMVGAITEEDFKWPNALYGRENNF